MADNYSQRAARGQAYNLAVATAIAEGKQHDNQYIVEQYLRHLQLASLLQKLDVDKAMELIKDEKLASLVDHLSVLNKESKDV